MCPMFPILLQPTLGVLGTHLCGCDGDLVWSVSETASGLRVQGDAPSWRVRHEAGADLRPLRTVRVQPNGRVAVLTFDSDGVVVVRSGRSRRIEQPGLWDADTLALRLGHELVAAGKGAVTVPVYDPETDRVRWVHAAATRRGEVAGTPCTWVALTWVGDRASTSSAAYSDDGQLLRLDGPDAIFVVAPPQAA
jgi:hypothetical protein